MMRMLIVLMLCIAVLGGCSQSEEGRNEKTTPTLQIQNPIGNPTTEDILSESPDADIFQWNGIVYSEASHIEWVQKEELAIGERLGAISQQSIEGLAFQDEMATKLPVGTEIFKPLNGGNILIAKVDDEEIRYLGLIEG